MHLVHTVLAATGKYDIVAECAIKEKVENSGGFSAPLKLEAAVECDRIFVMDDDQVTHFGSSAEAVRNSELLSSLRQ
ncbi:ATP-binding cassette transporter [Penicillium sp. CMV-2018d]|nr:ATP-binding cassette transporter [Penicillium sp. CMV-2018d]